MAQATHNPKDRPTSKRVVSLKDLWPFLKPYRIQMGIAFVLLSIASAALLLVPLAFRDLIDVGFGQTKNAAPTVNLDTKFSILFGLAAFWALMVAARYYMVSWIGERVTVDLRSGVYASVLKQSPQFFETLQTGEVLSRLTGDTTLIQTVVGSSASMGLRSLFQFTGGMVMLAVTSFYLFSINIGLMFCLIFPITLIGRSVKKRSRESQDRIADSAAMAGEILNAMPTVQSYTQETRETNRFADSAQLSFLTAIRRVKVRALLTAVTITAVMGTIIFVLWLGARQVNHGLMTGGELASFVLYAAMVAGSVSTMAQVWGDIMRAAGATERLLELLHTQTAIPDTPTPATLISTAKADIQLHEVTFHYPSRPNAPALNRVSLHIAAGETVALVGASGAGKTTIFQLLLRFYDAQSGTIRINNQETKAISLHDLRRLIAIVPQDPVIFSANVLENIRYGQPDASDAAVIAAATAAQVAQFVPQLPDGYHTFLGERGTRLSGGQRQRIAIARAMLKDAPILLLDEATSALDAESEILVQQGLNAAMQGRTTLMIAHRLATVQKADKIVVMENGQIVEIGDANALRQQDGLYARLAELQFV
ncbi:MAG: ABC transporter transmembrane domain-containing protein [Methylophilaceae bacterium]|nr:ABC transporter transmembrane domain-containing protein [Methylophilaceae bacterium]MDG1444890.1 ABC transporter transmembrane domain-containing protein [Methylophilaceae bacterium]